MCLLPLINHLESLQGHGWGVLPWMGAFAGIKKMPPMPPMEVDPKSPRNGREQKEELNFECSTAPKQLRLGGKLGVFG